MKAIYKKIIKELKVIKAVFIAVRHGINPFIKIDKIQNKLRNRLTDEEKEWIINNCTSNYARKFWIEIFWQEQEKDD